MTKNQPQRYSKKKHSSVPVKVHIQKPVFQPQDQDGLSESAKFDAVSAGRKAYSVLIPPDGCIYTGKKQRDLWTTGYKNEEREARYRRATVKHAETLTEQ